MSFEKRSSGAMVVTLDSRMTLPPRTTSGTADGGVERVSVGPDPAAPDAAVGTLPLKQFLKELHREKRRSERSKAPLSLVLYQIDDKTARGAREAESLLELLHGAKRATDIVGHVGSDYFAVLCPDTNEHGVKGFMQKIESRAGDVSLAAVAATYPDELFENFASGTRTPSIIQPLLASDAVDRRDRAYPLKRAMDIVGALLAIGLFAPLMVGVSAMVALTSRGPIIFKQTRVGKGGVPFTFYKFRSMRINSDDAIHRDFVAKLINAEDAKGVRQGASPTIYKLKSDPRVTWIGRLIRKSSIDELPQFFNVLKGDMSLVGPRPPLPYEAAQYQPWHLRRVMTVKPGITGIWQVEGRSKVAFSEMVRMDLRYIRECSLTLDIKILLRTILVVVRGEGAD